MTDDLSAPLGKDKQAKRQPAKLPLAVPIAVAGSLASSLLVFLIWTAVAVDPLGGEPTAVVAVDQTRNAPRSAGKPREEAPTKTEPRADTPGNPTQTVTIIDGSSGARQEVEIPAQASGAAAKPAEGASKLLESTRHGSIPRVALDGGRPLAAYARPVDAAGAKASLARVALVIGGLGTSAKNTAEAFGKLPGPVTFAFTPYGGDLERHANRARGEGHELLLQIPMEPHDYPENDPGPRTLLTSLAPEQNVDRLHWLMSRFQGYVGVTNYMGARFTASEAAFAPILRETAKRGLLYLDDATSPRSLAGQIAGANNVAFIKASIVLDAVPTPAEIDRALARLENIAREGGIAVGYATAHPVSIERLARWAKSAESRGFLLVPISAMAAKPKSS